MESTPPFHDMPSSDQGKPDNRYTLIPRTLIFLTRGDHVLLLKGSPTKRLWPNCYNGIGGHIEQGEDILTAAYRELQEESGLNPETLWHCGTITIDVGKNPGICVFLFKGECPTGTPHTTDEGIPTWIPISELKSYPLVEDLYTLLPQVLKLGISDPPLSVLYHYDKDDKLVITTAES